MAVRLPLPRKKAPSPIDKHVGSRVRMRRIMLAMSQEKLGAALGLTFQQVQKYEKGTNRIGASRLQQISQILQVPVAFFFEGLPRLPLKATMLGAGLGVLGPHHDAIGGEVAGTLDQRVVRDNRLDPHILIAATAAASFWRTPPWRPRGSPHSRASANGLRGGQRPASTSTAS
jgi:transcriptional regulator with XRE-family HTH domain